MNLKKGMFTKKILSFMFLFTIMLSFTGMQTKAKQVKDDEQCIKVLYTNQLGVHVSPTDEVCGAVGSHYKVEPKDLTDIGYNFLGKDIGQEEGNIPPQGEIVSYTYEGQEITNALIVHYINQNGESIAKDKVISGRFGDTYSEEPITIDNYDYNKLADNSAPESGTITNELQEIIYIYQGQKNDSAVKVHYVDENGSKIAEDKVISGNVGDSYSETPIEVEGYTYEKLADNSAKDNGKITSKTVEVTYVYQGQKNDEAVIIHYIDENGNKISSDKIDMGRVGDTYTEAPITIDGYEFNKLADNSAPESGTITVKTQEITYMYRVIENNDDQKSSNNAKDNKKINKKLPNTGN